MRDRILQRQTADAGSFGRPGRGKKEAVPLFGRVYKRISPLCPGETSSGLLYLERLCGTRQPDTPHRPGYAGAARLRTGWENSRGPVPESVASAFLRVSNYLMRTAAAVYNHHPACGRL